MIGEEHHGMHEEVVKVHGIGCFEPRLVALIGSDLLVAIDIEPRDLLGKAGGVSKLCLGARNRTGDISNGEFLEIDIELTHDQLQQALGICIVIDTEPWVVAKPIGIGSKDPKAG